MIFSDCQTHRAIEHYAGDE